MSYRILKTHPRVLLSDAEGIPLEWETYEGARRVLERLGEGGSIVYPQRNLHKVLNKLSMPKPSDNLKKID